jgi:glycosyltransferase involved in cell wall biosynthesis
VPKDSSQPTRILIFTPFASRTGSEMMLWYLLQHVDRRRFQLGLVCLQSGELLRDLPADVPVWVAPKHFTLWQKVRHKLGHNPITAVIRQAQQRFRADVWYLNTMTMPFLLPLAREAGVPVVTHFHEMPLSFGFVKSLEMKALFEESALLLGCSEVTSDAIRQGGGQPVETLHSFIDPGRVRVPDGRPAALRQALGIPPDAFVWVFSGTTSERKGFDLLPDIARELHDPNVHLVWVGQRLDDGSVYHTEQRCRQAGPTPIHLVGKQTDNYYAYLALGNGFVLASRQDPFPLVMIEAAQLGLPIVAFPSGGVTEFVQPGLGEVVDSWNVRDLVAAMRRIQTGAVPTHADASRRRAATFTVERQLPRWHELMARF